MKTANLKRDVRGAGGGGGAEAVGPAAPERVPALLLRLLLLALFALVAVVFTLPIYRHMLWWGIQDWDVFTFFSATPRVTMQEYGQFPLWNPWFCGGMPLLGRPESPFLTPFFLVNLLLGDVVGMKVQVTLSLWVGLCGMFALARYLGMGRTSSVLAAFVFMLGGPYTMHMTVGNTNQLFLSFMPWTMLFYLRAVGGGIGDWKLETRNLAGEAARQGGARTTAAPLAPPPSFQFPFSRFTHTLACALCLEIMWLGGCPYQLCMGLLLLGMYSLFAVAMREQPLWRTAAVLAGVVALVVGIGAVKFFPSIAFTVQYPRLHNLYCGFSLEALWHGLVGRDQGLGVAVAMPHMEGIWRGVSHGMNEIGTYVGVLPLLLVVGGLAARGRRHRAWVLCLLFFLWLSFGVRAPFSAWGLLHKLPVFNIMRVAERFNMVVLLGLAVFAGFGLELVARGWRRLAPGALAGRALPAFLVLVVWLDLMLVVSPVLRSAFTIPPVSVTAAPGRAFVQTLNHYAITPNGWAEDGTEVTFCGWSSHYPSLLANQGIIEAYEEIPVPRLARAVDAPDYRGEVYLEGTGGIAYYREWTPNRLTIAVDAVGAGYVVVNQNYYGGWRVANATGRRVESVQGLIGVRVDPGPQELVLYYRPASFVWGAWVSAVVIAGLLGWGAWRWSRRRGVTGNW